MSNMLKLLMLGAMYENGGNTTHRLLDGHPELFVYPFESQLGTKLVRDRFSSLFPVKYRWPVFDLEAKPYDDYQAIIDEECKVRARTPNVSKFRHMEFEFSDDERCKIYEDYIEASGRSRGNNITAYMQATFDAWKNLNKTGQEKYYVGYSPILVIDADKILNELPNAHFLHVVRNPWSAYADTKKRPVPLSLANYMQGWTMNQYYALYFKEMFPERFHILRTEDILADPKSVLGALLDKLGLGQHEALNTPSWNGIELEEVYPWGTLRKVTPDVNYSTAKELNKKEQVSIEQLAWQYLEVLDYKDYL